MSSASMPLGAGIDVVQHEFDAAAVVFRAVEMQVADVGDYEHLRHPSPPTSLKALMDARFAHSLQVAGQFVAPDTPPTG